MTETLKKTAAAIIASIIYDFSYYFFSQKIQGSQNLFREISEVTFLN